MKASRWHGCSLRSHHLHELPFEIAPRVAAQDLLDVDRADPGHVSIAAQAVQASGGWAAAQRIDQDGRVEQLRQLPNTSWVAVALRRNPAGRVVVPGVLVVGERAEAGFDVLPATLVLECASHGLTDEHAPTAPADTPVELLDQIVIQAYVQSHGHKLAHSCCAPRGCYGVAAISSARRSISPAPAASSRSATRRPSASAS